MISNPTTTTPGLEPRHLLGHSSTRVQRGAAVAAAVAASAATWLVLSKAAGVALRVPTYASTPPPTTSLGLAQVVVTTLVAGLLAWGVLAALERFSARPRRLWTVAAPVAAAASLVLPLSAPALSGSERLSLVMFHIVVAVVLILALRATASVGSKVAPAKAVS